MTPVSDDLHERFVSWLLAGAEGDPPRDVAIHASLCEECARWIAAHDALTGIDPGRAPLPPSRAVPDAAVGGWRPVGRVVAATGSLLVLGTVAALGVSRYLSDLPEGPTQQVLAVTGSPEPTPRAPSGVVGHVSGSPLSSVAGTVPAPPTARPAAPATHPRTPSPRPAAATATASPAGATTPPTPTSSLASQTPAPSASPTPTPPPSPTVSPIQVPSASA